MDGWQIALAALAVTVLNYAISSAVSSGKFAGGTAQDIRHIEAMLDERRRDIERIEESMKDQTKARHALRDELTRNQAMYWNEVSKRLDSLDDKFEKLWQRGSLRE